MLGLPPYLVRRLIDSGALPSARAEGRTYLPKEGVDHAAEIAEAVRVTALAADQ